MIKLDEEHRAFLKALNLPALQHGLVEHGCAKISHHNLFVFEQIQQGIRIRGHVRKIDDLNQPTIVIPVIWVLFQAQTGAMHPAGHHIRAVVEHLMRISAVTTISGVVKVFPGGQECHKGDHAIKVGNGRLKGYAKGAVVHSFDAEGLQRQFTVVYFFGIKNRVKNEGVLGSEGGGKGIAPGKHKVVGSYRLAIAPQRILAQPEGDFTAILLPALGYPAFKISKLVITQQPFHHMVQNHAADRIGRDHAVHLRGFVAKVRGDCVCFDVNSRPGSTSCTTGQAGQPVERKHQNSNAQQ